MKKKDSSVSRRHFLETAGAVSLSAGAASSQIRPVTGMTVPGSGKGEEGRTPVVDGPSSNLFTPIPLRGNIALDGLAKTDLSEILRESGRFAPYGNCVCWGIPFQVASVVLIRGSQVSLEWRPVTARWLVLMHTTDVVRPETDAHGFPVGLRGPLQLCEPVAAYAFQYADGSEERVTIRRQHQIGMVRQSWGAPCFEAVSHQKPYPTRTLSEQPRPGIAWGQAQTRVVQPDLLRWTNWLWAWQNPHPERPLKGLRIEPKSGAIILSALTAGKVSSSPLRWDSREKALVHLVADESFDPNLTGQGLLRHIQIDLGQVLSARQQTLYPNKDWESTYNNSAPQISRRDILVEYAAHPEARFHLLDGTTLSVASPEREAGKRIIPVPSASREVSIRVIEKASGKPVAVKLHVHGESGEYLAPADRNRYPDDFWYEDWSVDYGSPHAHYCTYIPGETSISLPLGKIYVEISKGFEIMPIRRVVEVSPATTELVFTIDRILDWRTRGWVTADTHVHFLSPSSANLEGAAEGVNVVNLLASQWGELMTNVGDFDGRTTHGGEEYLVRVGTENRQHVLGHISLLGYNGRIIAPMTTGGPDESAIGDPVDCLLTEWARQCRKQGGVVVLPHFPRPHAEHAAAIIGGEIDGVEMTSWQNLYAGIDPYSLSDWYRYLNNGHFVAAVGGTDKMSASTAVGTVRTYARLPENQPFDYESWKAAVRSGNTFATYGPLMEFSVDGKPPGSRIAMSSSGGTVDVEWRTASVTVPMSRVEMVVNGEIRESRAVNPRKDEGRWRIKVDRSSWLALMIRGHYPDKPEIIAAHSSPVMIQVRDSQFYSAADALTILEQIEGALVFLDTMGTRAEDTVYRRMRLLLTSAYRTMHNRLHERGYLHEHTPSTDHPEHHRTK